MEDNRGGEKQQVRKIAEKHADSQGTTKPQFLSTFKIPKKNNAPKQDQTVLKHHGRTSTADKRSANETWKNPRAGDKRKWSPQRSSEYWKRSSSRRENEKQQTAPIPPPAKKENPPPSKKPMYDFKIPKTSFKSRFPRKSDICDIPLESIPLPPTITEPPLQDSDQGETAGNGRNTFLTLSALPPSVKVELSPRATTPCSLPSIGSPLKTESPMSPVFSVTGLLNHGESDAKMKEILRSLQILMNASFYNFLYTLQSKLSLPEIVQLFNLAFLSFHQSLLLPAQNLLSLGIQSNFKTPPTTATTLETSAHLTNDTKMETLTDPNHPKGILQEPTTVKEEPLSLLSPMAMSDTPPELSLPKKSSSLPFKSKRKRSTLADILIPPLPMNTGSPIRKTTPSLLKTAKSSAKIYSQRRNSLPASLKTPPLPEVRKQQNQIPLPSNLTSNNLLFKTSSWGVTMNSSSKGDTRTFKRRIPPSKNQTADKTPEAEIWKIMDEEIKIRKETMTKSLD